MNDMIHHAGSLDLFIVTLVKLHDADTLKLVCVISEKGICDVHNLVYM